MAFLVILQRLRPAERAVLLLHDVFDFDHREIGELIGKSEVACRKLLERARRNIGARGEVDRDGAAPGTPASREDHRPFLQAFVRAASSGDVFALAQLLAEDAELISDGGAAGLAVGGIRNLTKPLRGGRRVAAFVAAATARSPAGLKVEERELNGQPAVVMWN